MGGQEPIQTDIADIRKQASWMLLMYHCPESQTGASQKGLSVSIFSELKKILFQGKLRWTKGSSGQCFLELFVLQDKSTDKWLHKQVVQTI